MEIDRYMVEEEKLILERTNKFGIYLDMTVKAIKQDITRRFRDKGIDLTPEQWTILNRVGDHKVAQRELADGTFKDAPTVSRIIDLLQAKGFLQRKADKQDRRKLLVSITDAGKEVLELSTPIITSARTRGWEGLNEDDYSQLKRILERIYSNIQGDQ